MKVPAANALIVGLAAALAAVPGVVALSWLAQLFVGRVGFALDLEWMEGGLLVHALRLQQGQGIYVPPSVDFIPFLYTPFYPRVLAWLAMVFPLGYSLGRFVSVLAFSGSLIMGGVLAVSPLARGAGNGVGCWVRALAMAVGAAGAVAASFSFTGAFFDLVRADSLMMLLVAIALACAYLGRRWPSAAVAGLAIALAFFTKQTAVLLGVGVGVGLLLTNWRRGLIYGVVAALTLALGLSYLQWRSGGWFWTYVFELHQSHRFNAVLAYKETPLRLLNFAWPLYSALLLSAIGLGIGGKLQRRDVIVLAAAAAGFAAACVGFGTQWAFDNAFIPAIVFPALAVATLGARLITSGISLRVAAALSVLVAAGVGYASIKPGMPNKHALVPSQSDHRAAQRLIQIISDLPQEGFIPFHPFYSVLAGHRPFVHRMGVMDVGAQLGRPAGLDEALATQRFNYIVLDWKSRPYEWPGLETRYHVVQDLTEGLNSVRMFSGAQTSPRQILLPIRQPPVMPPGAFVRFDFEMGNWSGWQPEGDAFAQTPAPAPHGAFGRFAIDSRRNGPSATGVLRSAPFTITGRALRFWLHGHSAEGLRVLLSSGAETPFQAKPTGTPLWVEWNVSALVGQTVALVVEDSSEAGGLAVDQIVELGGP